MSVERSTEGASVQQNVPDRGAVQASFTVAQRRNGEASGLQTTQASVAGALPLSPELQVLGALAGAAGKFLAPGGGSAAAGGAASGGSAAGGGAAAFGATLMKGGVVTVVGAGLVLGEAFIPGVGLPAGSSRSERTAQSGTLLSRIVKESPDLELGTDQKTGQRAAVDKVTGKSAYVVNKDGSLQIADGMKAIAADRAMTVFVGQTVKAMANQGFDVSNTADLNQALRDYATTRVGSSASPRDYAAVFGKLAGDKDALKAIADRAQVTAPVSAYQGNAAAGGSAGAVQKQPLPTYDEYESRILGEVDAASGAASANVMEQRLDDLEDYDREHGTSLARRVKKAASEKVRKQVGEIAEAGKRPPSREEQEEMEHQEAEALAGRVLEDIDRLERQMREGDSPIILSGGSARRAPNRGQINEAARDAVNRYASSGDMITPPPQGKPPKVNFSKTQVATMATVAGASVLLGGGYLGIREAVEFFGRKEGIWGSEPWTYPENADGSYFDEKRNPEFKETDHNVGSRGLFGVRIKETKEGEGADGLGDVVQIVAPLAKRSVVERKQLVDLEERVKPGQPILRVKDDDLEAEITKLETELKSLEGRIGVEIFRASKAKNIPRQEVEEIDAQIQEKEVDLARAEVDLGRINFLYENGAVSKQAQDEAVALVKKTKAQISDLNADRRAALTNLELAGDAANLSPTDAIEIMKTGTVKERANLPESVAEAVGNYLATLNELGKQLDIQARNTTYSSVYGTVTNSNALKTFANNLDNTTTLTDNTESANNKNPLLNNKNDGNLAILIDKSPDGPYGPDKGDALTVETAVSWDVFSKIKKGDKLPFVLTDGSTGVGTVDRLATIGEGDGYRVELKIDGTLTAPDGTKKKLDPRYADYIRVYAKTDPITVRPKPVNHIDGDDLVNEVSFSEASLPTKVDGPTDFPERRQDFEFSRPVYQKNGANRTRVGTVIVKGTVSTDGKTVALGENTTISFRSIDGNTAETSEIQRPETFGGSSYGGVVGIDGSMVKASVKLNVTPDNAARSFNATFGETRPPDSTETTVKFDIVPSGANDEIVRLRVPDAILLPDL
ncbi:hypothetical protein AADZ90_007170 [Aestuariibius sp. 2305UL40-4]|uniref:hypothetical protein n=1 Tax=Aestuariibius violaceus TaxID=3234132 RepID=UPI00345EA6C3